MANGDYIVDFVSGGPKNYAYTTAQGAQACKIRGFSLNFNNAQLLNFDSMKDVVSTVQPQYPSTFKGRKRKREANESDVPPAKVIVTRNPGKINRVKYKNILYNREEKKAYRVVYDKRVVLKNLNTVPYGY